MCVCEYKILHLQQIEVPLVIISIYRKEVVNYLFALNKCCHYIDNKKITILIKLTKITVNAEE